MLIRDSRQRSSADELFKVKMMVILNTAFLAISPRFRSAPAPTGTR